MIGQTIEARTSAPWGAVFFFVVAAAMGAVSLAANNLHWLIGAAMPLLVALLLLLRPAQNFRAEFTDTSIVVLEPEEATIPYDALEGVMAFGRAGNPDKPSRRNFAMSVLHDEGELQIPSGLNVAS